MFISHFTSIIIYILQIIQSTISKSLATHELNSLFENYFLILRKGIGVSVCLLRRLLFYSIYSCTLHNLGF